MSTLHTACDDAVAVAGAPDSPTAVTALARQLDDDPLNLALHAALAQALQAAGDDTGFLAHRIALATFDTIAAGEPSLAAIPLYNLATVYYMKGEHDAAKHWYGQALKVHPDLAIAHQNLAAIFEAQGQAADAQQHRSRAYSLQRVFIEPAQNARRHLLILCSGHACGNVPFETLLPFDTTYRIKYAIDYAHDTEDAQLPPFDLVFNAIGEPDIAQPLTARLQRFAQRCGQAMLNRPDRVARTQRHRMALLLAGIDNVVTAPCIRVEARPASYRTLAERLEVAGIGFPLLMRPLATHGGDGLVLHESFDTLWGALKALSAPCYLTKFIDFRSTDGHYRKYRTVFVDREPFPYHLAISSHWMVHYFSADMTTNRAKIDEERRFLEDPRTALGERAAKAIAAIGRRLDLDYGGIDFTLLPDGRVFVFEANATMLIHREAADGPLAHKNAFVQPIVDAFERLQVSRMGTPVA
ncbi:tetratricopeptide repeat protein [Paraburkholderia megapolitana]|uniref:Tetratricopeptide repeat-containing protein n=1 Tax=Paraburkholderia megapolitana TaxID=420953 RepID=A0A1I3RSK8_9BURK|nr:tetratricopeptide repeat protein [Paraburkholderia megapolitana]QDQ84010.1 tetratricopeptide repeat protein [Paraburkholderia megapolitana]SFJ48892.1 Tetratricopeptide repeat-containing protein [Paraburkholderia megapolitana]